jgi:crotonobetainyl-CoA:carnitine CoA-transferase CaiB-like acyl-CoA transferase
MESILDLQFEVITTHLNDGGQNPDRSAIHNGHAYVGAPYGIYPTSDGHIAIAMGSIPQIAKIIDCPDLNTFTESDEAFSKRDTIKGILKDHLSTQSTRHWLDLLEPEDIWCADVLTWKRLRESEGYKALDMEQTVHCPKGSRMPTLRCPIRIDGEIYKSPRGAPAIGQHNERIETEFGIS